MKQDLTPSLFVKQDLTPSLFGVSFLNRVAGSERHQAVKPAGEKFVFFNILEREAGVVMHVGVRAGALRDGWNATVFKHGVERSTHS